MRDITLSLVSAYTGEKYLNWTAKRTVESMIIEIWRWKKQKSNGHQN